MSMEETSRDEMELNEMSRGKIWENNNNNFNHKHSSFSNNSSYNYKHQQEQTPRQLTRQAVGIKTKGLQDHLDTRVRSLCTH